MNKVAIITGGSSGIGLASAEALLKKGFSVYSLSRRTFSHNMILSLSADVTDKASVEKAVHAIYEKEGRIDLLVNCAGSGIAGAIEFTDSHDAKAQFDVNFFGTLNSVQAVLPYMRLARYGRIINISSVAALVPIPFQSFYSASKAAINSFSQSLANEVKPFGISVAVILPGDISTGFTAARKKEFTGDDTYSGRIARSIHRMENDELNGMPPQAVGKKVARIA